MQVTRYRHEWAIKREQTKTHPLLAHMENALKDNKMSSIKGLLSAGKRLTYEEKEYLRRHDPALYHQAVSIEEEQRSFRRAMERCKTKDEVHWLYFEKTAQYADETSRVFKSSMPIAAKKTQMQYVGARDAAMREAYLNFKSDGKYSRLPTEQELINKKRLEEARKQKEEQNKLDKKIQERRDLERIRKYKRGKP